MTTFEAINRDEYAERFLLTEKGEQAISDKLDEILALLKTEHAPVKITMKRSSTKDAGVGFDVDIRSNATPTDVTNAFDLAVSAYRQLQNELNGEATG